MGISAAWPKIDLAEAILDVAGSIVFATDSQGRVIRWNQSAAAWTGISANKIRGQIFHDIVLFPGDLDQWQQELDRISSGNSPHFFEIRWKRHDSSFAPVVCSCSAIRDAEGRLQYIVGTAMDSVARELMDDRNSELRDVSRFLHATVAQDLVVLALTLSQLENAALAAPLRSEVESALGLIDRCCRDIRVVSSLLAPPLLSGTTLERLIEDHAAFVREETGLCISLDLDPVPESLSSEVRLLMFSAVQSWVGKGVWSRTNPEIFFRLRSPRSGGAVLEMEMVPPAPAVSVRGWALMRERARALGGEFSIAGDADRIVANMTFPGRAEE